MNNALNPRVTRYLYLTIVLCYAVVQIDTGIMALCNEAILEHFKIGESEVGLLATASYIGNIVGTLVCPVLFARLQPKHIVVVAAIANALFVGAFSFIDDYWIVFVTRLFAGFFKVVFVIYFPVWIDQKAPEKSQTMWISAYFLTVPLGIVLGFGSTMIITNMSFYWKWAFLVQTALMIFPISFCFALFPARYFSNNQEKAKGTDDSHNSSSKLLFDQANLPRLSNEQTLFNSHISGYRESNSKSLFKTFERDRRSLAIIEQRAIPISTTLKSLFKNPSFICSTLAITNVMFILTALQFWTTQYAVTVLKGDPTTVYIGFLTTVMTSPPIGALVGGAVTTKFLGSYTNPKALTMSFWIYVLFFLFCIPCPLVNEFIPFISLMWVAIFMQGFVEPIIMGIILNTVSPIERAVASSLSILIEMVLGMMPGPYVYGLVQSSTQVLDVTGVNVSRGGMYAIFFSPIFGGICLLIAICLRKSSVDKSMDRARMTLRVTLPHVALEKIDELILQESSSPKFPPRRSINDDE